MQAVKVTRVILRLVPLVLWITGCHSSPPPAPPPVPSESVAVDTDEQIPEVVTQQMNLRGENFAGCSLYEDAAEKIWGYRVQADLNLSVQVYEGKIDAADAEKLTNVLNSFSTGWKQRFKKLCEDNEKHFLAEGQYDECVGCLSDLLSRQKDYVNALFYKRTFNTDEAVAVGAHLTDCDSLLEPRGEKALRDNPF